MVSRSDKTEGNQPNKKILWWLLFGFGLGICLPALIGVLLFKKGATNFNPGLQQVSLERFERFTEEMETALFINPEAVVSIMESELAGLSDPLAAAEGYSILAEAEWIQGNYDLAIGHNQQTIDILSPILEDLPTLQELSQIYRLLVSTSMGSDQYNLAEAYYREMRSELIPLLEVEPDLDVISVGYLNLMMADLEVGDFDQADEDYQDLQDAVYPAVNDEGSLLRIGRIYNSLIEGAMVSYDILSTEAYSQELIDQLGKVRGELTDAEELLEVNNYLATAEINLGHFQFAAIYLNEVVEINPSPTNLYRLATIYHLAGNHGCAHKYYQTLIQHEADAQHPIYQEVAEEAVANLEEICDDCGVPSCP